MRDGSVAVSMVSPYGSSTFTHRILPSSGTLDKRSLEGEPRRVANDAQAPRGNAPATAGMTREGVLRGWSLHPNAGGTPRDCWCYARVKEAGAADVAPRP